MLDSFDVCDLVVEFVNTLTTAPPFTAKVDVPRSANLEDLRGLEVYCLPTVIDTNNQSRASSEDRFFVSLGFQRKLANTVPDITELRSLHALVREVQEELEKVNFDITGGGCLEYVGVTLDPVFSSTHLLNNRVFTSVLNMEYRYLR